MGRSREVCCCRRCESELKHDARSRRCLEHVDSAAEELTGEDRLDHAPVCLREEGSALEVLVTPAHGGELAEERRHGWIELDDLPEPIRAREERPVDPDRKPAVRAR